MTNQEQWLAQRKAGMINCKPLHAKIYVTACQKNQEAAMRDEAGRFASGVDPISKSCCKTCSHNRRADKPSGPKFDIHRNRSLKGVEIDWKKACQLIFDMTTTTPESLAKWVGVKVEAVNVWWKHGGRPRQEHRQRIYNRYRGKIDFRECVK